ncbi:cbb3-type cytochrome oxidase assembly protein CcoS [Shewanella zhangzhouensis]|uniref:cbb3-type cytochrome oxidase assembly protein CcoS n=1 Tax=Shewanella zhangzhouensis TaxID=2864213 RepID=UPI001C65B4B9|nr:cbb3-type cytochrome oxidase assembly protein CcoS [Shewanella zhangzhouensis]QYK03465.1 cbb3-type cytochrome oxidase assembly protein CcoS [Shewanella zhangzhouensis]
MSIIYILIPIAMLFVLIAVGVFFWAVRTEQFDDLDRQGASILFEEETPKAPDAHVSASNNIEADKR